jgi:arylsulfatase A-like enzyme
LTKPKNDFNTDHEYSTMTNVKALLLIAACLVLHANSSSSASAAVAAASTPNIVFLFADDQCTYSVGCYGNQDVQTPNMDQLARDGLAFDRHYNTTAICMASRASVFTGMYEYKTGCNFGHGDMRADVWEKSYPVLLREAGYLTAFAGKFGIVVEGKRLCEDDFDFWGGGPGQTNYETAKNQSMQKYAEKYPHSTLSYGAFGQDVIREAAKQQKPFCLSISFKAPHKPATPDPRFNDVYAGRTFTKPANFGREFGEHLSLQSKQGRQYPRFTEWHYDTDYDGEMAKYHQQVYGIDVALGMIRDELKAQGIADNTVVIYTSDNGYICGSHGYGSKVLPMEESSRVPLIIYDPRSPLNGKQIRCDQLTGNIDFAPTILELAGQSVPSNMDEKSLLGLLQDPTKGGHDQMAFINVYGPLPTHSLTCLTKQYKYTYWWYSDDNMEPVEELFDTQNNPLELTNFATSPESAATLQDMRKRYDQELAKWKRQAVDYNDYQRYATLFDRTIPLDDKKPLMVNERRADPNRRKELKGDPKRPRLSEKR